MKTQVYSWRVSSDLKSDLERAARVRKAPVSAILDDAVRAWLERSRADAEDGGVEQARLHAAAAGCLGAMEGGDRFRAEQARGAIRARLAKRHAR